ncbi:LPXTG cell wall anchor domain-containing protein [Cryobacterium sp. TMT2-17-1]|uniref:LPXTG cell wall anchor domain-containing protein n=1 Tax=Cryobacterium sp. TMT2-17-1 TaxID=1259248 RepID=UPI00106B071A|nr:LPXTG cell wall anchor domain-containing protein [Cryobacterium sp. TMT2-17-1]TFC47695.1 LPXTG cell wall anchor domain-containing protein [Cryobacterium sp. TMT2-17-1]
MNSSKLIHTITQCNGSINVGGGNTICTVTVNNHITGATTESPATVNQCVGSGASTELDCVPLENTTYATVTQCNNAGNGGGADVLCRVNPSAMVTIDVPITVNQCNYSSNGGGSTVECATELNTIVHAAEVTPTQTPTPTETALPAAADTITVAPELAATGVDSASLLISAAAGALLLGLGALLALRRTVVRLRRD